MICMTLQTKLKAIADMLVEVVPNTYHYHRPGSGYNAASSAPWLIWAEDGGNEFYSDNGTASQSITGTIDYYTPTEFDEAIDRLQAAFSSAGIAWGLNSVQYEEDTNLIHYEWFWEV